MPATSRSGDASPALLERPRGLAFEVDDQEVVLRDQHLAEVVVAVAADLQRRAARQLRRVDAREHALALRRAAPAPRRAPARGRLSRRCSSSSSVRSRFLPARAASTPRRPAAVTGSGSNAGSPELRRKREVQLGRAQAERPDEREVRAVRVRRQRGSDAVRCCSRQRSR